MIALEDVQRLEHLAREGEFTSLAGKLRDLGLPEVAALIDSHARLERVDEQLDTMKAVVLRWTRFFEATEADAMESFAKKIEDYFGAVSYLTHKDGVIVFPGAAREGESKCPVCSRPL